MPETKPNLLISLTSCQQQNPCPASPALYMDESILHGWPVYKVVVDLPIRPRGNLKRTFGNLLNLLGAYNKDHGTASQTL